MNTLRSRRLVALLLGALSLAKQGFAQECNAEDQFWDQVRAQCQLWAVTHTFIAQTWDCRVPYLGDVLRYQSLREAAGTLP